MNVEMSRRISRAMNKANPGPRERTRVVDAVQGVSSFDDLPLSIQRIIRRWEKTPRA